MRTCCTCPDQTGLHTAGPRHGIRINATCSPAAPATAHLAVQIAKARGAHVIGTASAAKHDLVASLGADELIDYRATDFGAHVDGVDVVLDTIGDDIARRSIGVLHPGGLLVTIVGRRDVDLAAHQDRGPPFRGLERRTRLPGP